MIFLIILLFVCYKRRSKKNTSRTPTTELYDGKQISQASINAFRDLELEKTELSREKIRLGEVIGQGIFGIVRKAEIIYVSRKYETDILYEVCS